MNNIINEMSKKVRYSEKSTAVRKREELARHEVLERYGVDDTRTLTAETESELFRRDAIERAELTDLYNIASATAYKKMRFKFNQGYDSFAVTNQSLHDELADTALCGMVECIYTLYGLFAPQTALEDEPQAVIRAGYQAMDSYINQTARDERKHMFADVNDKDEDGNELYQDVTAIIESGFAESELSDTYKLVVSALTARQKQVFKYMLKGYTDETIAKKLRCNRRNVVKIKHTVRKRLQFVRDDL